MDDDQGNEFDILCYRFMAIADITSELASWSPPEDVTSWTCSSTSKFTVLNRDRGTDFI